MDLLSEIMRFLVVLLLMEVFLIESKSTKKFKDESAVLNKKLIGKSKPKPAIIAIEIVDPNDNGTSSRNAKRTIESALGYGYQAPPRYEVYKYSQQDIPPYQGPPHHILNNIQAHNYNFQKSVSYDVPHQNFQQYYRPGTTLFSAINDQGQVEGLSPTLPQVQHQQQYDEPQVPVIILRVFPSQLADPSAVLHPNLPSSHPLASTINSIDIQALLQKYVQNLLTEQHSHPAAIQPEQHAAVIQQEQPEYHAPQVEETYQYVQPQQQNYHQADDLLTHENYPKDTHTRIVFNKNKQAPVDIHQPKALPQTYANVQTPHMQYSFALNQDQDFYFNPPHASSSQDGVLQSYFYQQTDEQPSVQHYQQYEQPTYQQSPRTYLPQPQPQLQHQHQTSSQPQYSQQISTYDEPTHEYQPPPQNPNYSYASYQPSQSEHHTPHNYHSHQKRTHRSKKNSRPRPKPFMKDIKLQPIKA